ncbi:MAG: phenylalanine--tRNA ligase subunit beta, partial [Dehalococcoidia bacterium]|nr:phenylalanine--tRNA ligase subunit beta [Dehalococcoidia bacterium]
MKVSVNWLKEYVPFDVPVKDLAHRLTMAGVEVGGIENTGKPWDNVVIGQVVEIKQHPNADRLKLAEVDLGMEKETVVCGAPNIKAGDKVAFARVGAQLFDPGTGKTRVLEQAKIRGVVSRGMACSERELGLSEDHEGVLILPPEAPLGLPLNRFLGDTILDLEVTPNRPDCFSILGVAREVGALAKTGVRLPETKYAEKETPVGEFAAVEIADPDLCSRYCATVINNVSTGPSPYWMQQRLLSYGMRPISNIVDITNYVMLEYGQPLHAFDCRKIRGGKIIVRRAENEEVIESLDGVDRKLTKDDLVIADTRGPVAIAGVMGGANSEVTESTTSILLESANFNPVSIRRTSIRLGLRSEASMRFEKGLRPEYAMEAIKRATYLLAELCGGEVAAGIIDIYPGRQEAKTVLISPSEVKRVLGIDTGREEIVSSLSSLGFECGEEGETGIKVTSPWWRSDINQPVDVLEELARVAGYDSIPMTLLSSPLPPYRPQPLLELKNRVTDAMVASGMQEVITYSLTNLEAENKAFAGKDRPGISHLKLANPLSLEQEYLRTSLRPGLLAVLGSNRRHGEDRIRIFEAGRVFIPAEKGLPEEREMLAGILYGRRQEISWDGSGEAVDFYDAKGIVENLFQVLGLKAGFTGSEDTGMLPGRTAAITVEDTPAGVIGEVHPDVARSFEVDGSVFLFEISVAALLPFTGSGKIYRPLARFPGATRDLAVIVDASTTCRDIKELI